MTNLTRPVKRITHSKVFEAGKMRLIVVTLEPPCLLKFRAKGCKKSYSLTTAACYSMAVKADVADKKKQKAKDKTKKKVKK